MILKENLASSLNELSIIIEEAHALQLFTEMDVDNDNGLSLEEFKRTVQVAYERVLGPYELWARSLPLSQILADALPMSTRNNGQKDNHLRFVSEMDSTKIGAVVKAFSYGLEIMLRDKCNLLKKAYAEMDKNKNVLSSGEKFNIATAGRIEDFHRGMTELIGMSQI